MSIKLLTMISPGYSWRKTGVNVYESADGVVEVAILHHGRPQEGYSELTFWWTNGLVVEGWVNGSRERFR